MKNLSFLLALGFLLAQTLRAQPEYTAIPDPNFEQELIDDGIDSEGTLDGQILTADAENRLSLTIDNANISDLTGIEAFINLITLQCIDNQLTVLNLSENIGLSYLNCSKNRLTSLDISNNTALRTLICYDNQLASLNLFSNPTLTNLNCRNNQLASLNLSSNPALTTLYCSNNQLNILDLSNNTALTSLGCSNNQLSNLDLSNNTALTGLACSNNQLSNLDLSKNTALSILNCGGNQLSGLDLSNNPTLTSLSCLDNQLSNLDLSNKTALSFLSCGGNQLSGLDLSNNSALTYLRCNNNQLAGLNLRNGNNQNITYFYARNNPTLTCIDVDDPVSFEQQWGSAVDPWTTFSDDCGCSGPDADNDGIADECDECPNDPYNDADADGLCGDVDNCPNATNPDQADLDGDGLGDACDPATSITGAAENLNAYIEGLSLDPGTKRALTTRVDLAVYRFCNGYPISYVISTLNNLIDYVEYQSGEDIPEEAASYIIAQLQALIDALNEGTVVCDEGDAPPRPGNTTVSSAALSLEIHPNPFSTRADIRFYLPQAGPVQLEVFNLQGQRVHSLLSGQLDKGISEFSWDGTAENGQRLNSGIYLIRLSSADEVVVKRVSLMR